MWVYIIFSHKLERYYCGHAENISSRLDNYHNKGKSVYTSKGVPWKLITFLEVPDRGAAVQLERKIKKRGIKRFLEDRKFALR